MKRIIKRKQTFNEQNKNRNMKIYLDTSVYGRCYVEESFELINWINANENIIVYHSDVLDYEINNAHYRLKKKLNGVLKKIKRKKIIYETPKSKNLAANYLAMGVLPPSSLRDAKHIAVASVNKVNYILSWNYKDMVKREHLFVEANKRLKVHQLQIIKPDKFLKLWSKK